MGQLDGKVAIVTGAGSGIGRATAERFLREGAEVIAFDVQESQPFEGFDDKASILQGDVSKHEDWQRVCGEAEQRWGGLDVLVNSAGVIGERLPLSEIDEADYDRTHAVNGKGTFLGMKYSIPLMLKRGAGSIVNIASVASHRGRPKGTSYMSSKASVLGLTRCGALDYGAQNIRVNAICPGYILTAMSQATYADEKNRPALLAQIPLGRVGQPSELAAVALFLASDESSFMTGTSLMVEGGMTIQ